jgi:hypothetical protein
MSDFTSDAKSRFHPVLAEALREYAPHEPVEKYAAILLDPSHPSHEYVYGLLEGRMSEAAKGHAPGMAQSEQGGWFDSWYKLGPGDQEVYKHLRNHNLLRTAAGREVVASPQQLIDLEPGEPTDYGPGVSAWGGGAVDPNLHRGGHLLEALGRHEKAAADPTHHSSFFGSYYPQHAYLGHQTAEAPLENGGDTVAGNVLSGLVTVSEASKRASRASDADVLPRPKDFGIGPNVGLISDGLNHLYRWGSNIAGAYGDEKTHQLAKTWTHRASPMVPEGSDPQERQWFIDTQKMDVADTKPPGIHEYGASRGKTYSPAEGWGWDALHEFVDPISLGSVGYGLGKAAVGGVVKGGARGAMMALPRQAADAVAREGYEEALSPLNYPMVGMTFPFGKGALVRPDASTIPADAASTYRADEATRQEKLARLRDAKSMISQPKH